MGHASSVNLHTRSQSSTLLYCSVLVHLYKTWILVMVLLYSYGSLILYLVIISAIPSSCIVRTGTIPAAITVWKPPHQAMRSLLTVSTVSSAATLLPFQSAHQFDLSVPAAPVINCMGRAGCWMDNWRSPQLPTFESLTPR